MNTADWSKFTFTIDGKDSFLERVSNAVMADKLKSAKYTEAQMAHSPSVMKLNDIENQYNQSLDEKQEANQSYNRAAAEVDLARTMF